MYGNPAGRNHRYVLRSKGRGLRFCTRDGMPVADEANFVDDTTKLRRARAESTRIAMCGPYISTETVLKWLYFSVVEE